MADDYSTDSARPIKTNLSSFYDHFLEFHEHCAFLFEATACMASEDTIFDDPTVAGIKRYCYWLKAKGQNLKDELRLMQQAAT